MVSRSALATVALATTAGSFFLLGVFHARREDAFAQAAYDVKLDALRAELHRGRGRPSASDAVPAGTAGERWPDDGVRPVPAGLIARVKEELQAEMGLVPVQVVRDRRASFVELYSEDDHGKTHYGTAGYLGNGYFLTVKHAVVALGDGVTRDAGRRIVRITVTHAGQAVPATVIDTGDADAEVHAGDWAVIRTRPLDLPPLRPDTGFDFEFAEPIIRLGNDYSKGIIVAGGYVGQRMPSGLVTALTDGHPGVSGGGVLDRRGAFVGIPIGRMQGDYRFSFILPLRPEMLRRVPPPPAASAPPLPTPERVLPLRENRDAPKGGR